MEYFQFRIFRTDDRGSGVTVSRIDNSKGSKLRMLGSSHIPYNPKGFQLVHSVCLTFFSPVKFALAS